jgi:hypothetical protein
MGAKAPFLFSQPKRRETMIDITYNRSSKHYEWIDPESGEVLTVPSGKDNKAFLFQTAISMLDLDLHKTASQWIADEPTLERVIWRGVELVAKNGIETYPGDGILLAKVDSSDEYGRYSVTNENGHLACECQYWQDMAAPNASNGERVCKHIAAFHLYQRTYETRF